MSSTNLRRPDFRLHLGYPEVTLLRSDVPGMVRLAAPDHPGFPDDLRRLAAAIDATNGRLTVILPDREVWRDRLRLGARTPWARRREARETAARALAIPAGEVMLSIGRRGDDGSTPLAATRRQTLVEVRRMLTAVGLRPQVIRGAGRFDGFSAPPALGNLRWNPAGRALPSRVDGRAPRAAMAAGGLMAAIAAVVAILGTDDPQPVRSPGPIVHQSVARMPLDVAEAAPALVVPVKPARPAQPAAVRHAAPPPVRPDVAAAAPRRAEAPTLAAARPEPPAYTVNTRNLDLTTDKDGRIVLKLEDLPGSRGTAVESGPDPLPRPRLAREAAASVPQGRSFPQPVDAGRPLARPPSSERAEAAPVADIVRQVALADTDDFIRPEHRPLAAPGVRVASLTPADAAVGALGVAAAIAPLARPDRFGSSEPSRPAPKPVETPAALPVRKVQAAEPAALTLKHAATAGAVTARRTAPVVVPVRTATVTAAPAPQPKIVPIVAEPKIARTVRAASAATAVPVGAGTAFRASPTTASRTAAARSTSRPGMSLSQLSLIGVFGDTAKPHALVRLPNGDIQRVRTGDSIAGLQVASVTSSGVRVRSGVSEAVLRLPE